MAEYKAIFNVLDFGACGDGSKNDTAALQAALDAARDVEGKVIIPAGVYRIGTVRIYAGVSLYGDAGWGIDQGQGGTQIVFDGDDDALGCLDISDAYGCVLHGLSLEGGKRGKFVSGIYLDRKGTGKDVEDTAHIENCRVANFTGDGLHFNGIWCDSVRHCVFESNGRYGVFVSGWDIFFYDNLLRRNGSHGLGAENNAFNSITAQNNRFEENGGAGLQFKGGNLASFMGNTFCNNAGPGIEIGDRGQVSNAYVLSSNTFLGNGRERTDETSCHVYIDYTHNIVLDCNVMTAADDGFAPRYGIVHKRLWSTLIRNNALSGSYSERAILDLGAKNGYVLIGENVGTTAGKMPLSWDGKEC